MITATDMKSALALSAAGTAAHDDSCRPRGRFCVGFRVLLCWGIPRRAKSRSSPELASAVGVHQIPTIFSRRRFSLKLATTSKDSPAASGAVPMTPILAMPARRTSRPQVASHALSWAARRLPSSSKLPFSLYQRLHWLREPRSCSTLQLSGLLRCASRCWRLW